MRSWMLEAWITTIEATEALSTAKYEQYNIKALKIQP